MAFLALLFLAGIEAASAAGEDAGWKTNYEEALKDAKAANKPILLNFTGSDWCVWCVRLDKDIFSKPKFAAFAKEKLVLLEADFPENKEQSADLRKQNEDLQAKYGVDGFPTLVLLDPQGKEIARQVGYLAGGPEAMIGWINESVAKR